MSRSYEDWPFTTPSIQTFGGSGGNHPNANHAKECSFTTPSIRTFGGGGNHQNSNPTGPTSLPPSSSPGLFGGSGGGNHQNPNQTGPTSLPASSSPGLLGGSGSGNHQNPNQTGPTSLPPSSSPELFGGSSGAGNHPNPSQTRPPSPGFSPGFSFPTIHSSSKINQSFFGSPFKNEDMSRESPFKNGDMSQESPVGSFPARTTTTTTADGHFIVAPKFMGGSLTVSPEEEAFKSRTPSSSLTHVSPQPQPPLCFPHKVGAAAASPSSSSLTPPPVQDSGFEEEISSMTAEKASILLNIKHRYPSCLSSLRLRSKLHRQAAYDHLFQVVQDLRAIRGGNGGLDLCDKVLTSLDDLEVYGFSMGWLREEVVQELMKLRQELMKQIRAIDANWRRLKTKLPFNSDGQAEAATAKLFSKTFSELQI